MSKPTKSAIDKIDTDRLSKLIASVAREVPVVTLEFEAATKIALRELCLLFGAGSEKLGRAKLLKLLTEKDEAERTQDACAALDEFSARLQQGKPVDIRIDLDDLGRALEAKNRDG